MPAQSAQRWLSIVPIAAGRSSYNGLLVLVFIALSAGAAVFAIHRFASRAVRRAPAWDCGFPMPVRRRNTARRASPSRSAGSSRRAPSSPASRSPCRRREASRRRFSASTSAISSGRGSIAPIAGLVGGAADRLNRFQFLTIRRYLSLVFVALVALLVLVALWP